MSFCASCRASSRCRCSARFMKSILPRTPARPLLEHSAVRLRRVAVDLRQHRLRLSQQRFVLRVAVAVAFAVARRVLVVRPFDAPSQTLSFAKLLVDRLLRSQTPLPPLRASRRWPDRRAGAHASPTTLRKQR